ncbi:MAG: phosphatidylglycerophosphatase A [Elusimicrobiota bacterium]
MRALRGGCAFLASGLFLSHGMYRLTKFTQWKFLRGCGIVGTIEAMLTWWFMPQFSKGVAVTLVVLATLASVAIAHQAERYYDNEDDPRIVIDEYVGFLFTCLMIPKTLGALIVGALIFRVFDVWKPFGIAKIEEIPDGWGCIFDDVASGIIAGAIVALVGFVLKAFF